MPKTVMVMYDTLCRHYIPVSARPTSLPCLTPGQRHGRPAALTLSAASPALSCVAGLQPSAALADAAA